MPRWLKRIALAMCLLVVIAIGAGWWQLHGSLPVLDGESALSGLSAPVQVQRDALGVVTIDAANETDAMRALGYVHAQERFFEMDLMRRTSAGELAELFGPVAVDIDTRHRAHRMRARAEADIASFDGTRRGTLQAYAGGVADGLAALRVRPWPYLLLRQAPRPWTPVDSALTGDAMYFDLQDGGNTRELTMAALRDHLPPALFTLLARDGSAWDAPLHGAARGDAVLPDAATIDLRRLPSAAKGAVGTLSPRGAPGSNNFAVGGALTKDGRAIVADDMHLGLRAPNIWFRARLRYADARAPGGRVEVSGFTLPGLPAVIVGSNTHVAWGFTNSYGDYHDWRRVRTCGAASRALSGALASTNCERVQRHVERIAVAGGGARRVVVEETDWGPILQRTAGGEAMALRWVAHRTGSLNLALADLAHAGGLDQTLAIADRVATPAQNLVIGARDGAIAWRLLGPLPQRMPGCDGRAPGLLDEPTPATASTPPRAACPGWTIATDRSPQLRDPDSHRLWTANNRTLDGEALRKVGDGGYALGARAQQIRDGLFAKQRFNEKDLLAIQLDDRALFLQRWWQLLRERSTRADAPALKALADASTDWTGRASVDSVGYRIVRAWRLAVHARLLDGLTAPAQIAMGEAFVAPDVPQFEGVAWPLVSQRPANLLPKRFTTWDALFEDAAREVRDDLLEQGPLSKRTWGERNTAAICHPLARAIPLLGPRLLCMPRDPLPGDGAMPRVQGPAFGASQRMVVAPGHEADGIVHMPGGQSGHPLSPFWGAGHEDWVHGRATPFLPGKATHTLTLQPRVPQRD